jgi:uncharacterized protein
MTPNTWLIDLSPEECTRLLAESRLGRLGVVIEGRPEIFPVNHVIDDDTGHVAFPTGVGAKLNAALQWPWVSFEIDGSDTHAEGSWSVLVVGQAEEITDQELIARLAEQRGIRVRWITGPGVRWLRIRPTRVSGRRITVGES